MKTKTNLIDSKQALLLLVCGVILLSGHVLFAQHKACYVSGYVRTPYGTPISDVEIRLGGWTVTTTDADGYYEMSGDCTFSMAVAPYRDGCTFDPEVRLYGGGGTYTDQNYVGTCSGGRHAYLAACRSKGFDAVVDCWGGRVVMAEADLTPKQPVSPITYTADLSCPILGIFGDEDRSPTPEQVNLHKQELQKYGKSYEFHRYPNAGHGFFYYDRGAYRQEQAVDGWKKIFAFLEKYLCVR